MCVFAHLCTFVHACICVGGWIEDSSSHAAFEDGGQNELKTPVALETFHKQAAPPLLPVERNAAALILIQ